MGYFMQIFADEVVAFDTIVIFGLKSNIDFSFAESLRHLKLDDGYTRGCYILDFFDIWYLNYAFFTLKI